jgi:hypothetical protein
MTSLKQRGEIRRKNIYTKAGDQTDKYIYYTIEQHDCTKTMGEDHRLISRLSIYICPSDLHLSVYICPSDLPHSIYICPSDLHLIIDIFVRLIFPQA